MAPSKNIRPGGVPLEPPVWDSLLAEQVGSCWCPSLGFSLFLVLCLFLLRIPEESLDCALTIGAVAFMAVIRDVITPFSHPRPHH